MSTFLIRLFVKDYKNTERQQVRTSYSVLAGIVGIIANFLLFITKFTIGFLINSISITADSFNNLSDSGSSVISLIGAKLAQKPADKEHPFGHGRFEYISAFIISFLILLVGFSLFKVSLDKVIHPTQMNFSWILVIILFISLFIKIWLSLFNRKLGNVINSTVLKATSTDARNDVLVTLATILSTIIYKLFDLQIDGWIGLLISLFVLYSGFNIAKDTLMPLLGEAAGADVYKKVTEKVESYEGILGTHDLIVHNYGPSQVMATIHAEVSNEAKIEKIHDVIDQIERDVLAQLGIFLVIHTDPLETNNNKIINSKHMVDAVVHALEQKASIHDFRVVNGENKKNLIFDLVVPYSYNDKNKEELVAKIEKALLEINDKYNCVITIENSFVGE